MTASQHAQYQDLETEAAKGNHIMVWMKLVFYTVEILKDLQWNRSLCYSLYLRWARLTSADTFILEIHLMDWSYLEH